MAKICLSVHEASTEQMWRTIQDEKKLFDMVELRIDGLTEINKTEISELVKKIKNENLPILWTVRWANENGDFKASEEERLKALSFGDQLGVDYVDIEYESNLWKNCKLNSAKLILSYHNFEKTEDNLLIKIQDMEKAGANIVKVAYNALSTNDLFKVCQLYGAIDTPLIAIAMGEFGEPSRILPALKNLPWSYAASGKNSTAPGQISAYSLKNLYRFDKINNQTQAYCVIGDPVSHSLSPYIHNTHYVNENINAVYVKIHVDQMEPFYSLVDFFGIQGVSVTVPHKDKILAKAEPKHWLHKVGAANTLEKNKGEWIVDNTDIAAAIESIECLLQVDKPKVLLLGAGGAAKGLAWGMSRKGWKMTIANRSIEKAQSLCEQIDAEILGWNDRNAHGFDVIVNCTTLGMEPNIDSTPMEFEGSHAGLIVFDTVYTPENTLFLSLAREVGAHTISGREMFYRQAAFQHAQWFKQNPPFEQMSIIMDQLSEISS